MGDGLRGKRREQVGRASKVVAKNTARGVEKGGTEIGHGVKKATEKTADALK